MRNKLLKVVFVVLFMTCIMVPLVTTDFRSGGISVAENRNLAKFPDLFKDGNLNRDYMSEIETWVNDHVGLRSDIVTANAKIQYNLYKVLANNSNNYLGPNNELNYATQEMLRDYQHFNYYSDEDIDRITEAFQTISDYAESKGCEFYYYQCWDKHSIYPEYFPESVIQYGDKSKTDKVIDALLAKTDINIISPKEILIENKADYDTYSIWGDPTHWSQRGAYIGYNVLINEINKNSDLQYKALSEKDYIISIDDVGSTLFGGIHEVDMQETFKIRMPYAIEKSKEIDFPEDERHRYFINNNVDNDTRILIMGDSYFNSFIIDDIAESFNETILIWGDYAKQIKDIINHYNPDILVIEDAERVDRFMAYVEAVEYLK